MLTYLLNIAFAIAATVLFIQAPEHYDYTYCQALMWVFIAQNALYFLTNKRKNWLGFEFFFALSFFNGIRSDEIMRLRNKDVNLEEGWIRVAKPKGFQHGMAPRLFQMMPTTMAWLNAFHQGDGDPEKPFIRKFVNPSYPRGYLRILSKKAGTTLELPDNAGRHSFITMHVALENNFAKTESIAGTGRDMREHNYMGLATKKQAEAYFAVTPETMEN